MYLQIIFSDGYKFKSIKQWDFDGAFTLKTYTEYLKNEGGFATSTGLTFYPFHSIVSIKLIP